MKHPEELVRLFKETDEEVLQHSDVLLASFQDNKSAFIARFPQLADPFDSDWAECSAFARALPPDYAVVAAQANQTAALENRMEQGRTLFQTVMLYTQLAFPNDAAVLRLFGQPQYDSARNKVKITRVASNPSDSGYEARLPRSIACQRLNTGRN